mmetsp:Transcript_29198/g.33626  ORF Transcript_29198/g.33626 Transcript_29198/m.33626 type:complete len:80 (+) Transcript_29198:3-242(+)
MNGTGMLWHKYSANKGNSSGKNSPLFQVTRPTLATTPQLCSKSYISTPSRKFRGHQQQLLTPKETGNKRQSAIYFSPNR